MTTYDEQEELFRFIADTIKKDVECYAFGGNAMMYYGYKENTKDVDLFFIKKEDREEVSDALELLGFERSGLTTIYIPEKLKEEGKPLVYKKGEMRFDLFQKKIFHMVLSEKMNEDLFAVHDYSGKHLLKVKVFRSEFIVLLKAVTERDRDFEDILTIMRKNKRFDWQYFIDEVLWQFRNGDSWALLDAEKMMKELKKYVFIEEKYFKQLYGAEKKKKYTHGQK